MKRKINIVFIIVLFAISSFPLLGSIFNKATTNNPITSLIRMPRLVNEGKINTLYFEQFDKYYSTHFPFRSSFILAYNQFFEVVFNESNNKKVTIGKEDFYFFNETLDDYFRVNTLTRFDLERINQVLTLEKEYLEARGIASYLVVVPNKATIYPEYMPPHLVAQQTNSNLDNLLAMDHSMPIIDLKTSLLASKENESSLLYHKQDSHWNNVGAAIGYTKILTTLNKEGLLLLNQQPTVRKDWKPDLALMLFPSKGVVENQYYYSLPNQFVFTRALRSFEDVMIESFNQDQSGSLFVFRDSFSNALIPYLSESFERVFYSRAFPYDYSLVDEFNPEHVIIQIAERNINWFLQQTPKLISTPQDPYTKYNTEITLDYNMDETKSNNSYFYNARYVNQEKAESITAVKVVFKNKEYNAFPLYQDDVEDDIITRGFSLYVNDKIDMSSMSVLVRIDGSWNKVK